MTGCSGRASFPPEVGHDRRLRQYPAHPLGPGFRLVPVAPTFQSLTIPEAVFHEVVEFGSGRPGAREVAAAIGNWIKVEPWIPSPRAYLMMEQQRLQITEVQAIELVRALPADNLLLDEQRAVDFARSSGLVVFRTGTLYIAAKRARLIDSVRPKLDSLRAAGFWLSERDYITVLEAAGEV